MERHIMERHIILNTIYIIMLYKLSYIMALFHELIGWSISSLETKRHSLRVKLYLSFKGINWASNRLKTVFMRLELVLYTKSFSHCLLLLTIVTIPRYCLLFQCFYYWSFSIVSAICLRLICKHFSKARTALRVRR